MPLFQYVSIDTETTGPDPYKDEIVEIGAKVWTPNGAPGPEFHRYTVFDPSKMTPEALKLHGISKPPEEAVTPEQAIWQLVRWLEELPMHPAADYKKWTIIGHNFTGFDQILMQRYLAKNAWDGTFLYRVGDTGCNGQLLTAAGETANASLKTQLKAFGIQNMCPHRALPDAVAEGKLFFEQVHAIKSWRLAAQRLAAYEAERKETQN